MSVRNRARPWRVVAPAIALVTIALFVAGTMALEAVNDVSDERTLSARLSLLESNITTLSVLIEDQQSSDSSRRVDVRDWLTSEIHRDLARARALSPTRVAPIAGAIAEFDRLSASAGPGDAGPATALARAAGATRAVGADSEARREALRSEEHTAIVALIATVIMSIGLLVALLIPIRRHTLEARRRSADLQHQREAEERFQPVFERHPQPMWVYDEQTLEFLAVNDAMIERYGYSREELLAMRVGELVDESAPPRELLPRRGATEMHKTKSGEQLEVEIHERAMTFGGHQAHMVLALDVTERRRIARALRESEERHRTIIETAQEGVVVFDLAGKVQLMNRRMGEILDVDREEQVGRDVVDVLGDDAAEPVAAALQSAQSGEDSQSELRVASRDGAELWLLTTSSSWLGADGEPRGVVMMCADITGRRETERRLSARARQQAAVARLGQHALATEDLGAVYDQAAGVIVETLGCEYSQVTIGHHAGDITAVALRGWERSPTERIDRDSEQFRRGDEHLRHGAFISDARTAPDRMRPALEAAGVHSGLIGGIVVNGEVRGTVSGHAKRENAFGDDERYFIQSIANVVASAFARHDAEEQMKDLARRDSLTGLPNRALFEERLALWGARARRSGAVIFVDVDRFKVLNDALGHDAGDQLLRELGPRFAQALGDGALVARFGGDEFVVLVRDVPDEDTALELGERLLDTLTAPVEIEGRPHHVSVSIGIKLVQPGSADLHSAVSDADSAMYLAKERGRERVELFDDALHQRVVDRLRADRDLRHALERDDELWCAYQPLISADARTAVGIEALARWRHPELGELDPAEFIPAAEELGLIGALGWYVLERSVHDAAGWVAKGDAIAAQAAHVSVNLSPQQLADPSLAPRIAVLLQEAGLPASRLTLEVTETTLMADTEAAQRGLRELAALGIKLVLDDFGTGFSSMAYLAKMPVSGIKIDRSFIRELGVSDRADAIVGAISSMADALGLEVVAEGVENESQALVATALGADKLQGFHFARPVPAGEVMELARQLRSPRSVAA